MKAIELLEQARAAFIAAHEKKLKELDDILARCRSVFGVPPSPSSPAGEDRGEGGATGAVKLNRKQFMQAAEKIARRDVPRLARSQITGRRLGGFVDKVRIAIARMERRFNARQLSETMEKLFPGELASHSKGALSVALLGLAKSGELTRFVGADGTFFEADKSRVEGRKSSASAANDPNATLADAEE